MGKRQRRRVRETRAASKGDGFARAIENSIGVMGDLYGGMTPEGLIESERAELREIVDQFDAVHLLGFLLFAESPLDPNSYVESEHEGAAFVVEMVAAECIGRPNRDGVSAIEPVLDHNSVRRIRKLVHRSTIAESVRRRAATSDSVDAERRARDRAAIHHLTVRNPGWPWQELHLLRGLFGEARTAAALAGKIGFDADDAIKCAEALAAWPVERAKEHLSSALADVGNFADDHPASIWATKRLSVAAGHENDEEKAHAFVFLWAWQHIGEAMLINASQLAETAGIQTEAASAFLARFSQQFGQSIEDWFSSAERFRWKPLIEVTEGNYFLTLPDNLLWAVRREFEVALSDDEAFLKRRSDWVEIESKLILDRALDPDESYRGVDFEYVNEAGELIKGEIDVLLRVGDVAIVCEAKGARLKDGAIRGGQSLIDFFKRNVGRAAEQTANAMAALNESGRLSIDGEPLSLGAKIREAHPIVVTIRDLSAVAPVIWEFNESLTLPEGVTPPWLVTLNELDAVAQTVEWPAQFIHFLRRRARLNAIGKMVASDELDWWMHYLQYGLYFENEDDFDHVFFSSLTDPLDAWMMYEHGLRSKAVPMPRQPLDDRTRGLLGELSRCGEVGRISGSCSLLEMSGSARKEFWNSVKQIRNRANARGCVQRFTMGFNDGPEKMLVLCAMVPESDRHRVADAVDQLVAERVDEHGLQRVLAIGMIASSKDTFEVVTTLEPNLLERNSMN